LYSATGRARRRKWRYINTHLLPFRASNGVINEWFELRIMELEPCCYNIVQKYPRKVKPL